MKRKIIGTLSTAMLIDSCIGAGIISCMGFRWIPVLVVAAGFLIGSVGVCWALRNEKAPDQRQLSQGHRKFYNIILAEGMMLVNGRTKNL